MTRKEAVKQAARDEWSVVKWPIYGALIFLMAVALHIPQRLEGKIFPVVAGTDVTKIVKSTSKIDELPGQILFYGKARKVRECAYDHIEWFMTDGGIDTRVDIALYESDKIRRPGEFQFGPWGTKMTAEELRYRSYAVVYHRCHWLWLTATHFYP
ncbi:hypothetical protein ASD54_12195 [Rhizobium sp. Root149]|uniref:hypothetical protein n=1 Tax=Rhizobium sp. Root149 TaxID=1736473 RepID=UPI000714363C|nr:hypothetical protein [Rhizobium sp. Root149]KQZ49692.1 hypothetical protein ASD54_12195 [Rhizobium sp. Root149]